MFRVASRLRVMSRHVAFANQCAGIKTIAAGDAIPAITVDHGFNPIGKVNMAERTKGKKSIILGLPGAFTPC